MGRNNVFKYLMKLLSFVVSHQGGFLEDKILIFWFYSNSFFYKTVHGNVINGFFFNFRPLNNETLIFLTCWR